MNGLNEKPNPSSIRKNVVTQNERQRKLGKLTEKKYIYIYKTLESKNKETLGSLDYSLRDGR